MGSTKNEEREGASLVTLLHRHPNIILHNKSVYLMANSMVHPTI